MEQAVTTTMEKPEKPMKSRYSIGLRSISLIIVVAFLLQDFASAQGGTPIWQNVADAKSRTEGTVDEGALNKISIPYESGLARKVVVKGTDDLIINIQDAHSKLGAQESITRILDNLVKNYDLNLIALEGASDRVDTSLVSSFPIEEARKKAGEYLLKEGKISAGEFYSMIAQQPVKLYGVDDPELYKENLDAFKALVDKKLEVRDQLRGLKKAIHELESKVYSPALLEMSNRRLLQKNGDIKFTEYWEHFKKLADENGVDYRKYENLKKLSDTVALEKEIDFKAAGVERDRLITELGTKLPKTELEKLVLQALQFKQNKITPGTFHYTLSKMAEAGNVDPARYPNIIRYSAYVVLYENIDLIAIFDEVEAFENEIRAKLFTNADEQALADLSHCVMILSQLLDTTLSSKDYEFFVANEASCEIDAIRDSFQALGEKYRVPYETYADFAVLKASIPNAKKFYELADRRNKALMENTVKRMRSENVHVAALITGGFHSEGISKLMDDERLSYLVVMPKFDDKSPNRPYIAILTQKPKEYEEAFKDSDFYLAAAMAFNTSAAMINAKYGTNVQAKWQADMKEALAAALFGARLAAGVGTISDDIKEKFLANLDEYQTKNPDAGEYRMTGALARGWLRNTTRVNKQGSRLSVNIDGRKLFTTVENGVMGPIQDGGAAESEEAVSQARPAATPSLSSEEVSEADVKTLLASVRGNDLDRLREVARRKGFGEETVKVAAARLAAANEASILQAISDAETLEKVTEIFHDANTRGMGSQAVRDAAMKRRLTLIPEAIKKASSIEEAEAILKSETYQLPVFVNDTEIRAALDAKREEIRQRDAKRIADIDAETARLVSERVRAIQGAETRDALEAALNNGPANIAKLPSVVTAYRTQVKKLAAVEVQAKVRDLIVLIEETSKTADLPSALGELTKDIPIEIVTDDDVQDAVAKARAAILKRAAEKREAEKPAAVPAPQSAPAVSPAPVSNAEVQRQADAAVVLIKKIKATPLSREEFLNSLNEEQKNAFNDKNNKAVQKVLAGKKWAEVPAAKQAAEATPVETAQRESRDTKLSKLWGAIRDAKDIKALGLILEDAHLHGLATDGIKKYLGQRTAEILEAERAKTAEAGLTTKVFSKYRKDRDDNAIDLETRLRESFQSEGRSKEWIDRLFAETDYGLVHEDGALNGGNGLEDKNRKRYRETHHKLDVEKTPPASELWKKAKKEVFGQEKGSWKTWRSLLWFYAGPKFGFHLFFGFILREPMSDIWYKFLGKGRKNYLTADETVQSIKDEMLRQYESRVDVKTGQPRPGHQWRMGKRDAKKMISKAAVVTLLAAFTRFFTGRIGLFIVSSGIVAGFFQLLTLATPAVAVLVLAAPLGALIFAAIRYAPAKEAKATSLIFKKEVSARTLHIRRMVIIGVVIVALAVSLASGVPFIHFNVLTAILPAKWAVAPVIGTFLKGGMVQMMLSPYVTSFIRLFWRESVSTRRTLMNDVQLGLPLITEERYAVVDPHTGIITYVKSLDEITDPAQRQKAKKSQKAKGFLKKDDKFAVWNWDGATVSLYLEMIKAKQDRSELSTAAASQIKTSILAVLDHDKGRTGSYNKFMLADAGQRNSIENAVGQLHGERAPPAESAKITAVIEQVVKRAGFEARRQVFGSAGFWRRVDRSAFGMWLVNTEISVILKQLGVFDWIISKIFSVFSVLFTGAPVELHILEPLGMVIDGASVEHPLPTTGWSLIPKGSIIGDFAEHGGFLAIAQITKDTVRSAYDADGVRIEHLAHHAAEIKQRVDDLSRDGVNASEADEIDRLTRDLHQTQAELMVKDPVRFVPKDTTADEAMLEQIRAAGRNILKTLDETEKPALPGSQAPGRDSLPDGEIEIPKELLNQAPGRDSLPDGEMTIPDELMPKEEPVKPAKPAEPKAPEVPAFPAPEPLNERVPVAGDVDVDAVLAKFDLKAPRADVIKAIEEDAAKALDPRALRMVVVQFVDKLKADIKDNPDVDIANFAVVMARAVRDANALIAQPGMNAALFDKTFSEQYGSAMPDDKQAPAAAPTDTEDRKTKRAVEGGMDVDEAVRGLDLGQPRPVIAAKIDAEVLRELGGYADLPAVAGHLNELREQMSENPKADIAAYAAMVRRFAQEVNGIVSQKGIGTQQMNKEILALYDGAEPEPQISSIRAIELPGMPLVGDALPAADRSDFIRTEGTPEAQREDAQRLLREKNYKELHELFESGSADQPRVVIWSIKKDNTFGVVRGFKTTEEVAKALSERGLQKRYFTAPADGSSDVTEMLEKWNELKSSDEVDAAKKAHQKVYVWLKGKDFEGVIEGGIRDARESVKELLEQTADDMLMRDTHFLMSIGDPVQQAKAMSERYGVQIAAQETPYAAITFNTDDKGHIAGIEGLFGADAVKYGADRRGIQHRYIEVPKTPDNPIGRLYMTYWPFAADGATTVFRVETPAEHMARYGARSYNNDPRFGLENGRPAHLAVIGGNYLTQEEMRSSLSLYMEQRATQAADEYVHYLDIKTKVGLVSIPITLMTGWGGNAVNFLADIFLHPQTIGRPPTRVELQNYLINNGFRPDNLTAAGEERMLGFLVKNRKDSNAMYLLGLAAAAGNITSQVIPPVYGFKTVGMGTAPNGREFPIQKGFVKDSPAGSIMKAVFANDVMGINGDIYFLGIANRIAGHELLPVPVGISFNIFEKLRNDRTPIAYRKDAQGNGPFPVTKPTYLHFTFGGVDPHQFFVDLPNARQIAAIRHRGQDASDPKAPRMYIWNESFLGGTMVTYSKEDMPHVRRAQIGTVDDNGEEVPIWRVEITLETGEKYYYNAVMTEAGAKDVLEEAHALKQEFDQWLGLSATGGYFIRVGPQGGTLAQNTEGGWYVTHDFVAPGYPNAAFAWTQGLATIVNSVIVRDRERAAATLTDAQNYVDANTKPDPITKRRAEFPGFLTARDAAKRTHLEDPTPGPNAAIGIAAIIESMRMQDGRFSRVAPAVKDYLVRLVNEGGGAARQNANTDLVFAEPNALVYAFLIMYANTYHDNEARQAALRLYNPNSEHDYFKDHFLDAKRGKIRSEADKDDWALDAATRWMAALGTDEFARMLGGPEKFAAFLDGLKKDFLFTRDYVKPDGTLVKDLRIADLATEEHARHGDDSRKPEADGNVRVGVPEGSAELGLMFLFSADTLRSLGRPDLAKARDKDAADMKGELNRMMFNGHLPQSTRPGAYSGYDYFFAQGDMSLDSELQFYLFMAKFDPLHEPGKQIPAITLPPSPAAYISEKEARYGRAVSTPAEVAAIDAMLGQLRLSDKNRAPGAPMRLLYDSPTEHVYIDEQGRRVYLRTVFSEEKKAADRKRALEDLEESELLTRAAGSGIPGPEGAVGLAGDIGQKGAVVFTDADGKPVPDKDGHRVRVGMDQINAVLDWLDRQPLQVKNAASFKHYANVAYPDGKGGTVYVTVFFPKNAEVVRTSTDPGTGIKTVTVYKNGLPARSENERSVTDFFYDAKDRPVRSQTRMKGTNEPEKTRVTVSAEVETRQRTAPTEEDFKRPHSTEWENDPATGRTVINVYGLYALPIRTIDPLTGTVTDSEYDPTTGAFVSSRTYELLNAEDFSLKQGPLALLARLKENGVPSAQTGALRYTETGKGKDADGGRIIERVDADTKAVTTLTRDAFGREMSSESAGLRFVPVYEPGFHSGRIPKFVHVTNLATGDEIETWETLRYEAGNRLVRVTSLKVPGKVEDRSYSAASDEPESVASARFFTEAHMDGRGRVKDVLKYGNTGTLDEPRSGKTPEIVEKKLPSDPAVPETVWLVVEAGRPDRIVTRDLRGRQTRSVTRTERTSAVTDNTFSDTFEQGLVPQTYTVNGETDGVKSLWADGEGLSIGKLGAFVGPALLDELQKNFGPLGAVRQHTREHVVEGSTVKAAEEVLVFDERGRAVVRVNLTGLEIEVLQTDGSTRVSKIEARPDGSYTAAAEALYLVKDGKPITINGVTYPTKIKVDPKTDKIERVFAVGAFGSEKVRITMLTETEAEAELIIDGKKSDIYDLTIDGDGTFTATEKPTFTVVSQGPLTVNDRSYDVKLRRSVDGATERLFAVDGDGIEKVRITMFSADEGEAELVKDKEHSDIFKAKKIDGRFSIYGERIGYTEGVPLEQVLSVKPENLTDVERAANVYRLNDKTAKFEWSETLLLRDKNDYVAVITAHPLFFTPDKKVIDVFDFASDRARRRGEVRGRTTYEYSEALKQVVGGVIGTSIKDDPSKYVDYAGNPAIAERFNRPGVSFFKIEDKLRGISWYAYFDPSNRSNPIGRIQNDKLYIPKLKDGLVQDGDDTYELLRDKKVGRKIFTTELNTSINRESLIKELRAHGFDDAASAVGRAKIFDIKALDPTADGDRKIKHFIGVFDKYQELIKIDVDLMRASVKFFDRDKPWIERGGLDLDYENGQLGELLGLSVVLNPLSNDPNELKQVFALDTAGKSGIIEHRERVDGTPLMKEDVKYNVDLNNKNVETLDQLIRNRNWDELNTEIRKGWSHFTRIVSEFGDFTNTGKGDGRHFSEVYLRSMAVPIRSYTEFWVPDPAAGGDKEKGKWEKDPQNILGGKEPMTRSELGRLEVVPGMTRIWVLREDRIPNVGRTEGSAEPTAISKYTVEVWDGAGNKVRSQFGHTTGSTMRERFENYDTELDLILFFFRGENDLHRPYHGKYKVADKSVVIEWRYDEKSGKNQPYLSGLANSTDILESGPVLFAAQRGYSDSPLTTTDYDALGDLLKHGRIKLDHVLVSNKEIKNRPGHLKVILEGFEIDQNTGFAQANVNPEFITFLEDSDSYVQLFHVGVAPGGYTYEFDPSKGIEVEHYAPRLADGQHRDWGHTKWVARSTNLHFVEEENIPTYGKSAASGERFQKEWAMDYDVIDHREGMQGLKHITIRLDGRPAWMEFLKAGNNSAAIQRTHLDGSGIPSYVTTVDGETGKEVLYARIMREFDPVYKGYLWAYKKTVDNMESINEEGLSLFFNGHEILYWQDLFAGGVVNEKAPYVPSTKNSYLDRFLFLPLAKMTGTDDKRAYFEERRAQIASDPDSFIHKQADDSAIPPAFIRTDTIRPAYFKETPRWLRALDPTTWDFKIGGFRVPWYVAAFGLPVTIFILGVLRFKRKKPTAAQAALQVTAPTNGARDITMNALRDIASQGAVEDFLQAYRALLGKNDQADTHIRVFEALNERHLLTAEHMRLAVGYLEKNPPPTDAATAYEFYRAVIREVFAPVIDRSFDAMKFDDASNGSSGVIAKTRDVILNNILHDLSQRLAVHPDFLNADLSINRPEKALIPAGQFLTTGHETADTVQTWVWREVLSQPTSTTGMFGEMAGRSRLLDFMVRGIQQRLDENKPETIRPFIASYVEFWQFLIPAQGQGRNIVNKAAGAPRGLLLELRDEGADNFYEKIGVKPGDLFTDLNFDDLYRYYKNPMVELMPRIKQELSDKFGLVITETDETKFVTALFKTLKGLDRTKPEHARYFKTLIKEGDSTKWLINMPLQAVATLLSKAAEEKVYEDNPILASLAGKTGVLNLYRKATLPLPFHVSSDGWKAFFAFWGNAELAKKTGKLTVLEIAKGIITTPVQRKFFSKENPNGASGRSARSRFRFWVSTVAIWSIYIAGLFGAIAAFLYGFTVIVGGLTVTTVFAWVASAVLLGFFAIVTYPAITMIAFGVVGLQEGIDKKVAKVGYWSLWGWPVKRMVKAMHAKRDEIEPVSGRSYGRLLSKLADLMFERHDISAEERDAIKDGSFRTKSGGYVKVKSPTARDWLKQFINTIYIEKPGLESWEKLMSLTQLISSSDDSPFAYSYDQILVKGGQDGRQTKLYYLSTRRGHRREYEHFLAYVSNRYHSAAAVALIGRLKTLQANTQIETGDVTDPDVRGVLNELEKWFNRRQYTNIRLIESLTYVQDSYMDYAENYFYDEEYQTVRGLLTGDRIYRGAAPVQAAGAPPFTTLKDAYRAAREGHLPGELGLTTEQIAKFVSVYDYYKKRAVEKLQIILREDGIAGQITFDKEGNISGFGLAENMEKTLSALEGTGYVRPAGVPKLATWSKGADGKDKVDSVADFEVFAPQFDRVVESLNSLLVNIRAELRPIIEAGIASKDPDQSRERLKLLALLEERVNFSQNDHLTNLYKPSILQYKTFIENLAEEYGFTSALTGTRAWKQLGILAPEGVMENITKLRDYSKAQASLSANGMEYFKASKKDVLEGSKYGGWGRVLHHARGQILQGIDSLQEVSAVYAPRILNVMTEFSRDPRLSVFLNGIQGNTEFFSMASGGAFFSESTWNLVSQRAKQAVDVLGLYGKGFLNNDYIKRYEGLQTDPVSEDIVTAIQFMNFGLRTKFGEYFQMGWRTAANLLIYTNPSGFKYPSGQAEYQMILSRQFDRFLMNPNLPVSFKLGLLFNSWFYYKKPFVLGTISAFVIIAQVLKWNLFVTLPYAALWTLIGALLAESINVSAFVRAWERDGFVKGTVMTLITVFRHMPMFVLNFFSNSRGNFEGARARSKFIPTSKAGELIGAAQQASMIIGKNVFYYNVYGEVPFKTVNAREAFGQQIKWGSWFTVLLMAFMPLSAGVQGMWILYLLTVFFWVAAPFLYTSAAEMWTRAQRLAAGASMLLLFTHPYLLARFWPTLPIQYNPLFALGTLAVVLSTKIGRKIFGGFVFSIKDPIFTLTGLKHISIMSLEKKIGPVIAEANIVNMHQFLEDLRRNWILGPKDIEPFEKRLTDAIDTAQKKAAASKSSPPASGNANTDAAKKPTAPTGARLAQGPETLVFGEGFLGSQQLDLEEESGRSARSYSRGRLTADGRPMDILDPTQLKRAVKEVGDNKGRIVFEAGRGATRSNAPSNRPGENSKGSDTNDFIDHMIDNVLQVGMVGKAMAQYAPEAPVVLASSSFAYVYARPSNGSMTFKEKDGDVMKFDLPDETTFARLQNYLSVMTDRIYSGEISAADRKALKTRMKGDLIALGIPREWLGTDQTTAYKNAYALSKVLAEQALQNIKVSTPKADGRDALNYYILRLGNVYGEGQQPERAIRNFTTALLRYALFGEPVRSTVFLPDLPRQYIDARDVARFIQILLDDPTNAPGEIINVADDLEHVTARAIWYRIFKNAVLKRELRDFAEEFDLLSVEEKPQVPKVRLVMDTTRMEDKIARYNRSHPDNEFHLTRLDSGIDRVVAHEIGMLVKSLSDWPQAMADFKRTYGAADESARMNIRDLLARALTTAKENKDTAASERLNAMLGETRTAGARLAVVYDAATIDQVDEVIGRLPKGLADVELIDAANTGARLAFTNAAVPGRASVLVDLRGMETNVAVDKILDAVHNGQTPGTISRADVLNAVADVLGNKGARLALPEPRANALVFSQGDHSFMIYTAAARLATAREIQDSLIRVAVAREGSSRNDKIDAFVRDFAAFAVKVSDAERAAALNGVSARFVETLLKGNIDSNRTVAINVRGLSPERENDLNEQKAALEAKGAKVVFTNYATLAEFKSAAADNNWSGIFLSGDAAIERKITDPPVMAIDPKAESVEGAVAVAYRVALLNGKLSVYIPGLRPVNNILIFMPIRQVLAEIMRQAVTTREATGVSA